MAIRSSYLALIAISACGKHSGQVANQLDSLVAKADLRISPETADLTGAGHMIISTNSDIVVSDSRDRILKVFQESGKIITIGRDGDGPGEFRSPSRIGWLEDSLWVIDARAERVSIFGPDYTFVRSFQNPMTVSHPDDVELESQPAISVWLQSVLDGGDLRVAVSVPSAGPQPTWATQSDSIGSRFLRISESGEFVAVLATAPESKCWVTITSGKGMSASKIAFCNDVIGTQNDGGQDLILFNVLSSVRVWRSTGSVQLAPLVMSASTEAMLSTPSR